MARLNTVDPTTATGRVKEIFDGPLKGKAFNIFKSLANSPAALDAYLGLSGALGHGQLSGKEREAIQLAIGEANACGYCVAAHTAIGKGAGLTEQQTIESRRGTLGDAKLNALVHFALSVHEKHGHVSDDDLASVREAGYTDGQIAEIVANYALATFTNYFNHLNQTPVDFPAAPQI